MIYSEYIASCISYIKIYKLYLYIYIYQIHKKQRKESCWIQQKLNCNNTLRIDFSPNGILFGAQSIGKVWVQS